MKKSISKLFIMIIVSIFFLITGCQTTSSNLSDSNGKGFSPSISIFEKQTWISFQTVELFQDDDFLYISLHYSSKTVGKYSLFDPPGGDTFKILRDLPSGDREILDRVEKGKLESIEGITILFFPGDFSNESERTGLFIHSESIKWKSIPEIVPGQYIGSGGLEKESDSSELANEDKSESNGKGFSPSISIIGDQSWISFQTVELFQDDDSLYISLRYSSDSIGRYSLFDPPEGNTFKILRDLFQGEREIMERVEKEKLKNIEGITILFFPGDNSNGLNRAGLFFGTDDIDWRKIPRVGSERYAAGKVVSTNTSLDNAQIGSNQNLQVTGFRDFFQQIRTTSIPGEIITHIDDPKVHGMWYYKDFVDNSIDSFDPDKINHKFGHSWKNTSFENEGILKSSFNSSTGMIGYWTKGKVTFVDNDKNYNFRDYILKEIGGEDFLFVEWSSNEEGEISYYVLERRE